jgi:hypothetical protein
MLAAPHSNTASWRSPRWRGSVSTDATILRRAPKRAHSGPPDNEFLNVEAVNCAGMDRPAHIHLSRRRPSGRYRSFRSGPNDDTVARVVVAQHPHVRRQALQGPQRAKAWARSTLLFAECPPSYLWAQPLKGHDHGNTPPSRADKRALRDIREPQPQARHRSLASTLLNSATAPRLMRWRRTRRGRRRAASSCRVTSRRPQKPLFNASACASEKPAHIRRSGHDD